MNNWVCLCFFICFFVCASAWADRVEPLERGEIKIKDKSKYKNKDKDKDKDKSNSNQIKFVEGTYSDVSEFFFNSKFWFRLNYGASLQYKNSALPSFQFGYNFKNIGLSLGAIQVKVPYGTLRADSGVSSESDEGSDSETEESGPTKVAEVPRGSDDAWNGTLYEVGVNYFTKLKNFSSVTGLGKFSILQGHLYDKVVDDNLSVTLLALEASVLFPLGRKNTYFVGMSLNYFWGYGVSSSFPEPEHNWNNTFVLPLRSVHYNISFLKFL